MRDTTSSSEAVGETFQGRPRTHGFRFSLVDGIAIVVCGVATVFLWPTMGEFALLLPYVLGHFFLFCNIFRIQRRPELIWAGLFVANVVICLALIQTPFVIPLMAQLPVTAWLIVQEIRKPTYHGILAHRWNKHHLAAYLRGDLP